MTHITTMGGGTEPILNFVMSIWKWILRACCLPRFVNLVRRTAAMRRSTGGHLDSYSELVLWRARVMGVLVIRVVWSSEVWY